MGQICHDPFCAYCNKYIGRFTEKLIQTNTLYRDIQQDDRLNLMTDVMGSHPTYLQHFLTTQNYILRGDGPLPYDYRHYIAIMAAGRHQCSYLIEQQKEEFLNQGGDPSWLKGLNYIPKKLRALSDINKILAHRPWLLCRSHIEKLTKSRSSWSLAEVVHAIVLLAHFHCVSSFVYASGVLQNVDSAGDGADALPLNESLAPSPEPQDSSNPEPEVGVETLMARMKTLSECTEEPSQVELTKRFETVESQSVELAAATVPAEIPAEIGPLVDDATFLYQDFARRGMETEIATFRVQDYSWEDHGYSLVNRLYNDVGYLLDEKFRTAYNLTYYTMAGCTDVDTSRFRRAIWNYIQCMFGIRHDDYDYGEVNQLVARSLKTYIKMAACYPERITKADFVRVLQEFRQSERVHVNLVVLEARMQAELLYALRAVMQYMT